ncbi:YbfB/YjiJ family MFS transporter [Nocardia beijingensis]|uniref:YbfB/YjiJ family MFS transporter n=1 Tax=Nocardia beijingensis TaxID=95162 RepID=UPI001E4CEB63|nr:YbfB/YjiJ family MFS transporter [Nocardia beijingensis]
MTSIWQAARLALGTAAALGFARFAYGLLLPAMRHDLGWNLADAGMLSTANGLGYLVGAVATLAVVRRLGAAAAFRTGMTLTAMALTSTAVGNDHLLLLATRAVAGAAGAVVFITGGVIASHIATQTSSGTPIAVYFAGTGVGIVLSGTTVPLAGDHWRMAWVGLGIAASLATLASWAATRVDSPAPKAAGRAHLRPLWPTALAYLLFAGGYITYITFLSAYLVDRHASTLEVMSAWTAMGLAVVAAPVLWSHPISRRPGRALCVLLAVLGAGAALALATPAPPVLLASTVVYGATFMSVPAAVTALVKDKTAPVDWTATLAAFTTVFAVGQTAGPWIAGILADHTSTDAALACTAIACVAASASAAIPLPRSPSEKENDHDDFRPDTRHVPRRLVLRAAHRAAAGARPPRVPADPHRSR